MTAKGRACRTSVAASTSVASPSGRSAAPRSMQATINGKKTARFPTNETTQAPRRVPRSFSARCIAEQSSSRSANVIVRPSGRLRMAVAPGWSRHTLWNASAIALVDMDTAC